VHALDPANFMLRACPWFANLRCCDVQVEFEFDFIKEAGSMDRISESLRAANWGKAPIAIPRSVPGLVTKKVLVMDFIEGTPILKLADEMAKRGINPNGAVARMAKRNILRDLSSAYGQMILRDGFFQADPHPGNVLINKDGKAYISYWASSSMVYGAMARV
jgi:aarF domain-containing kinase